MNNLKVVQLNCHNAVQANIELGILLTKYNGVIALLQEPYVNSRKIISNLPKGYDTFPGNKTDHKRTAIIASKHLCLTEINELCTKTLTAVGGIIENKKLIFASIYMHYDKQVISDELKSLTSYCRTHNFQLILGADSNSHSNLWGPEPKRKCKRGEELEECILQEGFEVHNTGDIPTFENKTCSSHIDITLSFQLDLTISGWTVSEDYNGSDHKTVADRSSEY